MTSLGKPISCVVLAYTYCAVIYGRKIMTYLSNHFTLEELIRSDTAVRLGIDNSPTPAILDNLTYLAGKLEDVRRVLGNSPITISSGYRCPKLNRKISKAKHSSHMDGLACDFTCPAFGSPQKVATALAESGLEFDQVIYEGTWVHISFKKEGNRGDILTATFNKGVAIYSRGIA